MTDDLDELVEKFIDYKYEDRENTWADTCRRSAHRFVDYCDEKDIDPYENEWDKYDIEMIHAWLPEKYSGSTKQNIIFAMRELLRYGISQADWDVIIQSDHPNSILQADIRASKTRYEVETGDEIPYVTRDEHEAILEQCSNPRDTLLFKVLWDSGCRPVELREAKTSDVNFEQGSITVQTAKRDGHTRDVYLKPETKRIMGEWLYRGGRKAFSSYAESSDYLFPTKRSGKMSQGTVNRQIKRWAEKADVQETAYTFESDHQMPWMDDENQDRTVERRMVKINAKAYRHSFCVRAVKNGISLGMLADLVGHVSPDSLKHYLTFREEDRKDAFDRFT
jgi:integrase/recombinase XerD